MKRFLVVPCRVLGLAAVAVATFCWPAAPLHAQQYWFETYERAVDLLERGEATQAAPLLESIMDAHPVPVSCLRVPGDRCLDYLPYYHLARVQVRRGDFKAAAHSLDIEAAFGAVFQNRRTERAYTKLRDEIRAHGVTSGNRPPQAEPASSTPH